MEDHNGLLVEAIVNGPFAENCFFVADGENKETIVIDPGFEPDRLLEAARERGLQVTELVCTHAHIDHAGAVAPLKRTLGVPFSMHADDKPALQMLPAAAQMFGLPDVEVPEVDRLLAHGDSVTVGGLMAEVIHTPGHSPGGCCLHFAEQKILIAGDTLFAGSVGRTDLPGGDTETLLNAIKDRLLALDDDTVVYCGHGPSTTIGSERRGNPFLQPGSENLF